MRYRRTAVVLTACAMAMLPAGAAFAGSGPAPKPSERSAAAKSTAPSAAGNPSSRLAEATGVCPDAYQIGTTGYVKRNGATIASVKQFYSPDCRENYGYVWVWDSFRNTGARYDVSTGVYSYDQDKLVGGRSWTDTRQQEFWSDPADTVSDCTSAVGSVRKLGEPNANQAFSSKRC